MSIKADKKRKSATLYRVSTKGQVFKDDIPQQRKECRDFAEAHNWDVVHEYIEKGVSGFKKTSEERDVIQQIKQDALAGKFEILLLFMSDRLGRLEDDTLELAKWFLRTGVEIWTVRDGQIRNDNLGDKIMNVIRFATAQEESEKTSYRVSSRMKQLTEQGVFTGGVIRYGYDKVRKGRQDKKGRELYDLEINEAEAHVVREIFDLYVHKGWGTGTIATHLNEKGLKTKIGSKFQANSINRILGNFLLIGFFKNKDVMSNHIPELQIIDRAVFERAQVIMGERAERRAEQKRVTLNAKTEVLLSGNIYCGHCGARVNSHNKKDIKTLADGTKKTYSAVSYYHCSKHHRDRTCDGQGYYIAEKIDHVVTALLKKMFTEIKRKPKELIIEKRFKDRIKALKAQSEKQQKALDKEIQNHTRLKKEIALSICGESVFTPELLKESIDEHQKSIEECQSQLSEINAELADAQKTYESIEPAYAQLVNWADIFDTMGYDEKKMVTNQLINRVNISRGYSIEIELNMDYKQFCENWELQKILAAS